MAFKFKLARRLALLDGVVITALVAGSCSEEPVTVAGAPTEQLDVEAAALVAPDNGVVLVGTGNIARCGSVYDDLTAKLLDNIPGTIFTTGDNIYDSGSSRDFDTCYNPSWGRHRSRTRPAAGDREYRTSNAAGYFAYFGSQAGSGSQGYYSYDVGDWHIVVLNSNISTSAGSAQEKWLRADLAATTKKCTAAYWHHPRFSSYSTAVRPALKPLWDALYEHGAELIINGHYRIYERFRPQTPDEKADAKWGIRQFTVGTGGQGTDAFGTPRPNSEVRRAGIYGVLRLTLEATGYRWDYISAPGSSFTDSGSDVCHGPPGSGGVSKVRITPDADTIATGTTTQLSAVALDAAGKTMTGQPMSWSSRDTLIAKVSAAGLVTGLAAGTAAIIASSDGVSDTAKIVVVPAVAAVTVSPGTASLEPGETVDLSATPKDASGRTISGASITWSTNAPAIATVNSTGVVKGVAPGAAIITANASGKSGHASITVTSQPASSTPANGFFVSPNGSSGGDGSLSRPWSLEYALSGAGGRIKPGQTVWLRGGTYRGGFTSTLRGTSSAPITVRQYPGERAIIDGRGYSGSTFQVRGDWTIFRDFELMNSDPDRYTSSTSSHTRTNTLVNNASHTRYINLVVHDGGVAFYNYTDKYDVEVYGSIFYNNGWEGGARGHGHALYIKSDVGPVILRDNILFNQFGYGIHAYTNGGSGSLRNIRVEGNIAFNNGTLASNSSSPNILVGGEEPARSIVVRDNLTYYSPGVSGTNVKIGYSSTSNADVRIEGNYAAGGSPVLDLGRWSSVTVSGNMLVGRSRIVTLNGSSSGQSWGGNMHVRDPDAQAWRYASRDYTFSSWRDATHLASSDKATSSGASTRVIVKPNAYEPGRATIVVYNWSRQGSVAVDLSGVLKSGDRYEIRNVQNLHGSPVLSGTFGGGSVFLPMNGVTPPTPVGLGSSPAPRTGPEFDVFIVTTR